MSDEGLSSDIIIPTAKQSPMVKKCRQSPRIAITRNADPAMKQIMENIFSKDRVLILRVVSVLISVAFK